MGDQEMSDYEPHCTRDCDLCFVPNGDARFDWMGIGFCEECWMLVNGDDTPESTDCQSFVPKS
jgi:hypothetical protein